LRVSHGFYINVHMYVDVNRLNTETEKRHHVN
jgi:hypothetical protein